VAAAHLAYRPDVDGLRAVAVLAVVGFHAWPSHVPGGFVGVDVFFVISGFLITGLLLAAAQSGELSLRAFWIRRVRRIFPALVLVLAGTLLAGVYFLLTHEFRSLARQVAASAAFVQNVVLWREVGYFDASAEMKPLLHLWSLSVEEQFYLVWPLLIVWALRTRSPVARIALAVAVLSFALSVGLTDRQPAAAFFLMPPRLWELAAGGVLACWLPKFAWAGRFAAFERSPLRDGIAIVGALLLAAAVTAIDGTRRFPGFLALLPVAGTLCLIAAGPNAWFNRTVLRRRALVYVGLISYPLYLWHWPLLSFARILEGGAISTVATLIAIAVAFALAAATYAWVERPVRRSRDRRVAIGLILAMFAVGLTGVAAWRGMVAPRLGSGVPEQFDAAAHDWDFPGATFRRFTTEDGLAVWSAGSGPRKVMVYGDSNAQQYGPRVERLLESSRGLDTEVVFATTGTCPPLPGVAVASRPGCRDFGEQAMRYAMRPDVAAVVIAAQWAGYLHNPGVTLQAEGGAETLRPGSPAVAHMLASFGDRLRTLTGAGKKVYVVLNIPVGTELDPRWMLRRTLRGDWSVRDQGLDRRAWDASAGIFNRDIAEVAAAAGAVVIDPFQTLCKPATCPAVAPAGEPMYRDVAHLRASFVRDQATWIDEAVSGKE
jgi:peptidoglycan/LPS O-acetylase OafA/YrhL